MKYRKHLVVTLPFMILMVIETNCQIAYYDAIRLKEAIGSFRYIENSKILSLPENDEVIAILSSWKYCDTCKGIKSAFKNNPFIQFDEVRTGSQDISGGKAIPLKLSNLAGLNVTNFADGLAKFLVDRFKKELSAAFFDKFKNDINDPKYADLRILFPETWKTLNAIDKDIYQYSLYLNTLRQSFIKDFSSQYHNLQVLLDQPKYKDYFRRENPELGTILNASLYFINEYSTGKHPGLVLANFRPDVIINLKDSITETNIRNTIRTVQLFSESFRSVSLSYYWVPADSVKALLQDTIAFRIFLGLIYQKSGNIEFLSNSKKPLEFRTILTRLSTQLDSLYAYEYYLGSLIDIAQEVDDYINELKLKKKSDIDLNDYYRLFKSSLDLLDRATLFIDLPYVNLGDKENKTKNLSAKILFTTRTTGDLYVDIRTNNYSSALINTVSILDTLLSNEFPGDLRKRILKYGSFMASIVQAQSSDDIKNVIESVALPAGSFSIKQKSSYSLSVNGYMGYAWDFNDKELYMKGIYAPIGLAVSRGAIGKKNNGGAIVAFISIIDIGGLTAYRLDNATDTLKQNIKLQSIISPSIQLLYEIPKTPVNVCIGWRMTPSLFYSGDETFTTVRSVSAINLSVLIDIPIFAIKTWEK